jgi:predicted O-methyltransferase YrrM
MSNSLEALLRELENFGRANDGASSHRSRQMLNIPRDTGEFLAVLVRAIGARRVLEIGTSNGYSTLWLADAARAVGGSVVTVENCEYKSTLAANNFARSDLAPCISLLQGDAGNVLARSSDGEFDFIFLDSDRQEYVKWWRQLRRVLRPGGLLVVDNATSHAEELASFMTLVTSDVQFVTSLVPVGKGEFLAVKAAR